MNFQKAQNSYLKLKQQLDSSRITSEVFSKKIQELRFKDKQGAWWQIREDGVWLRWDGATWQEAVPAEQQLQPEPVAVEQQALAQKPSMKSQVFRYIRRRLIFMIFFFLFSWFFHTYVLAVVNDGFNPSTFTGKFLNTKGNSASATVIWGLVSAFLFSFLYTLFTRGPIKAVVGFVGAPFNFIKMMVSGGKVGYAAFILGTGLSLCLSSTVNFNPQANFVLAFIWMFFGLSQPGYILGTYLVKGWFKATSYLYKGPQDKINYQLAQFVIMGMSPGFLVAAMIHKESAVSIGVVLIIIGVVIVASSKSAQPAYNRISSLIIIGLTSGLTYILLEKLFAHLALADDGGKSECGGTFAKWAKCQGSGVAIARGVQPALASSAGVLAPPFVPMTPGVGVAPGTEIDGLVWYNPPDDIGGWQWMKKDDYLQVRNLQAQGYIFSKQLNQWIMPEDEASRIAAVEKFRADNQKASVDFNRQLKADMDALKAQQAKDLQAKLDAFQAKQDMLDFMWEKHLAQQRQSQQDNTFLSMATSTAKDTAYYSARAAVTGENMDGSFNIAGLGTRVAIGVYTGGLSEAVYIPTGMGFTYADSRAAGEDVSTAAKKALGRGAFETVLTVFGGKIIKCAGYLGGKAAGAAGYVSERVIGTTATATIKSATGYVAGKVGSGAKYVMDKTVDGINYVGDKTVQMGKNVINKGLNLFSKPPAGVGSVPTPAAGSVADDLVPKTTVKPPPHLESKLNEVKKALASGDDAAIARLYENNGMKGLSELEKNGLLSPKDVAALNKSISNTANECIDEGVKNFGKDFEAKTGVKVKKVMLGDSGSSASKVTKPAARTDFDKTAVFEFDADDVARYAKENCGGNISEALDDLQKVGKSNLQGNINKSLEGKKLFNAETAGGKTGPNELDLKIYDRFGKPGPSDSYPSRFVQRTQETAGKTTVHNLESGAKYNTSGQAITDQQALNEALAGDRELIESQMAGGAKLPASEIQPLMKQQLKSVGNPECDMTQAAKAYQRAGIAGRAAGVPPDPVMTKLANEIRKNPTAFYNQFSPQQQQIIIKQFGDGVQNIATGIGM